MNMDDALNEPGPSRPKRIRRENKDYQKQIGLMLFDSDSDENYDISDYSSEYEYENVEQVSDDFHRYHKK